MQSDTPLIDFFRRVYAPLKLAGHRSQVERCRTAIDALAAFMGRQPTLGELVQTDPPPADLVPLRTYLVELGVPPSKFRLVVYRGNYILVPSGLPTPQEIELMTNEIQTEWSEAERRVRAGGDRQRPTVWTAPEVNIASEL
jgi:hypothetical protein